MQQEEIEEVPLIYPLVSVTLRSVSIVDGNRVMHECEEILNTKHTHSLNDSLDRLFGDFRRYVNAVIREAKSPKGRDALQHIRDTQPQDQWRSPGDPPLLPAPAKEADQGMTSEGTPPAEPDKASL